MPALYTPGGELIPDRREPGFDLPDWVEFRSSCVPTWRPGAR